MRKIAIRLGVPAYPAIDAEIHGNRHRQVARSTAKGWSRSTFRATNDQGDHVSGTAVLCLLDGGALMSRSLAARAAIAGIGQTEFSKESGRSELQLACEAIEGRARRRRSAARDVDGLVTFTMDSSEEIEVARNLGIRDLTFFSRVPYGGGAAAGR